MMQELTTLDDLPTTNVELEPEKIEDWKDGGPSFSCDLYDTELVHKIAQGFIPGLATACVDNTSGDIFRTPVSVAAEVRKEMVEYITQRSESFVAESVVLEGGQDGQLSDHPYDIISDFVDDFASSKRNLFSRVSGWLLSEKREDNIDLDAKLGPMGISSKQQENPEAEHESEEVGSNAPEVVKSGPKEVSNKPEVDLEVKSESKEVSTKHVEELKAKPAQEELSTKPLKDLEAKPAPKEVSSSKPPEDVEARYVNQDRHFVRIGERPDDMARDIEMDDDAQKEHYTHGGVQAIEIIRNSITQSLMSAHNAG